MIDVVALWTAPLALYCMLLSGVMEIEHSMLQPSIGSLVISLRGSSQVTFKSTSDAITLIFCGGPGIECSYLNHHKRSLFICVKLLGILLSSWHLTPTLLVTFPRQSLTSGLNIQSVRVCSLPVQLMLSMSISGPPSIIRSMKVSRPILKIVSQ